MLQHYTLVTSTDFKNYLKKSKPKEQKVLFLITPYCINTNGKKKTVLKKSQLQKFKIYFSILWRSLTQQLSKNG